MTYFLKTISPEGKISLKALAGKQTTVLKATGQMRYEVVDEAGNVLQPELQNGSAQWLAADGQPALIVENYTPMAMSEAANPALNPALKETVQASEVAAVGSGIGVGKIALGVLGLAGIGAALGGGGGGGGGSSSAPASNNQAGSSKTPVIRFDAITGDNVIDKAESQQNITISGTVEHANEGDTLVLLVGDGKFNGTVQGGKFSIAVNGSNLANHESIRAEIKAADQTKAAAEHRYTRVSDPSLSLEQITGDNHISRKESQGKITIKGVAKNIADGTEINVVCGCPLCSGSSKTATVQAGSFSVDFEGATLLANGHHTITAKLMNAPEGEASPVASQQYTTEALPDLQWDEIGTNNIINAKTADTVTLSGSILNLKTGDKAAVSVKIGAETLTATVENNRFSVEVAKSKFAAEKQVEAKLTVTHPEDGTITDTEARPYLYDVSVNAPTVTVDSIGTINHEKSLGNVRLSGNVQTDADVAQVSVIVTVNNTDYTASVSNNRWTLDINGSLLTQTQGQNSLSVRAEATDKAGNTASGSQTATYNVDTQAPIATISFNEIAEIPADGNGKTTVSGTVSGEFSADGVVTLTANGQTFQAKIGASGAFSQEIDNSHLRNGNSISASLELVDAVGNRNVASKTSSYSVKAVTPPTESETESGLGEGGSGDANAGSTVTPPSSPQTPPPAVEKPKTPEGNQAVGGEGAGSTPATGTQQGSGSTNDAEGSGTQVAGTKPAAGTGDSQAASGSSSSTQTPPSEGTQQGEDASNNSQTPPTVNPANPETNQGGSGQGAGTATGTQQGSGKPNNEAQGAGGQDAGSTTTPAEDTPKGSNSSATGSNAGSESSTANGQTDGQGGESAGAETKPNIPQPSQPTSPAAGSDAAGKDGATGSTASGSGDAGAGSTVTPPSTQTTPPAVEEPKTPEGNQAAGGEGADTKPAAGTGESSGNQAGDSKTEDSSSTQTPPEVENPKTPENNQNAGGQGAGSTTTPATGTPNGSQTPPAEEKPTTPETNQGDSGQDSSSSATTPTTGTQQGGGSTNNAESSGASGENSGSSGSGQGAGSTTTPVAGGSGSAASGSGGQGGSGQGGSSSAATPAAGTQQGGGSTNNAEGSGGQGTGTKPAAGTGDSQTEDSQGEDSQDASGSNSAATPAAGTPNGTNPTDTPTVTPPTVNPTNPETNQGGSGQGEGAGSGTPTQPNAGGGNANDAAAGGSSGNTTPPTTEQPVPPAPPAPTPPAADTDTDDEDTAEDSTEEAGADAANPSSDAPPAVPPAIAPRSLANTIAPKPSTPKAPKPEIRLDDFHDKLSSEKAALDDSFIVARGTVNLPGLFGKYKNSHFLKGIQINIDDKSYQASFDPNSKKFEVLISKEDLPSLQGKSVSYVFNKSRDTLYDIEYEYGGYRIETKSTPELNQSHLQHDENSPLRNNTFNAPAQSSPTVTATTAQKVELTGTVKNANIGDAIEIKVGNQTYNTTVKDGLKFSQEVDAATLKAAKSVTATLKNGDSTLNVGVKSDFSVLSSIDGEFVTKHTHIDVGAHTRPYFLAALMQKSTTPGIDYKLYHQDQDQFDADVTSTFKYRFPNAKGTNGRTASETDKQAFRKALDSMSDTANVNFVEDTSGATGGVDYYVSNAKPTRYGDAAYGGEVTIYNHHHILHDRMVNTIIHETFHSLGLKHTDSDAGMVMPTAEDDRSISVMSVKPVTTYKPQPSIYDLVFLHYRFGVRPTKRAESNVYKFKAVNESTIDRDVYIWDGAGVDTFDASDQKQGVTVNLTPGSWIHSGAKTDNFLIGGASSTMSPYDFFGPINAYFSSTIPIDGFGKYNVGQAFIGYGTQIEKLIGSDHNDTLSGNKAGNHIWGGKGNDTIFGDDGNDYLDGGAGTDTLKGGLGDDIFVVDSTGDKVEELANQGTDTVHAYVSYTLPEHVENLILYGSRDIDATGNGENNTLIGNDANNRLEGGAGVDTLTGNRGDDIFVISDIATADTITDFNVNDDKFELKKSVFSDVDESNIRERIQYDSADGKLYYQSASGTSTHFATVSTGLVLDESHFILV